MSCVVDQNPLAGNGHARRQVGPAARFRPLAIFESRLDAGAVAAQPRQESYPILVVLEPASEFHVVAGHSLPVFAPEYSCCGNTVAARQVRQINRGRRDLHSSLCAEERDVPVRESTICVSLQRFDATCGKVRTDAVVSVERYHISARDRANAGISGRRGSLVGLVDSFHRPRKLVELPECLRSRGAVIHYHHLNTDMLLTERGLNSLPQMDRIVVERGDDKCHL